MYAHDRVGQTTQSQWRTLEEINDSQTLDI